MLAVGLFADIDDIADLTSGTPFFIAKTGLSYFIKGMLYWYLLNRETRCVSPRWLVSSGSSDSGVRLHHRLVCHHNIYPPCCKFVSVYAVFNIPSRVILLYGFESLHFTFI